MSSVGLGEFVWLVQQYLVSGCIATGFYGVIEGTFLILFCSVQRLIETESAALLAGLSVSICWISIITLDLILWRLSIKFSSISTCWTSLVCFFGRCLFLISLCLAYLVRQRRPTQILGKFGIARTLPNPLCLISTSFIWSSITSYDGSLWSVIQRTFPIWKNHLLTHIHLSW